MIRPFALLLPSLIAGLVVGCNETGSKADVRSSGPPVTTSSDSGAGETVRMFEGTVRETMNAGAYTYVHVESAGQAIWAAAPVFEVAVGDRVLVPEGIPMKDFHSKTLDRDFEVVYFVAEVQRPGDLLAARMQPLPPGHPAVPASAVKKHFGPSEDEPSETVPLPVGHPPVAGKPEVSLGLDGIAKPEGGRTVAEVFAQRKDLVGEEVVLRGRVIKFNPGILGRNWLHIKDGSGEAGTNDLTVTTAASARVGDLVVVRGTLALDRDFGAGYTYAVILEESQVTIEETPTAPSGQ